jgi:hypothetical protein
MILRIFFDKYIDVIFKFSSCEIINKDTRSINAVFNFFDVIINFIYLRLLENKIGEINLIHKGIL